MHYDSYFLRDGVRMITHVSSTQPRLGMTVMSVWFLSRFIDVLCNRIVSMELSVRGYCSIVWVFVVLLGFQKKMENVLIQISYS